ncbi:MAG: ExbD/TolR family protein [Shimia sp.]
MRRPFVSLATPRPRIRVDVSLPMVNIVLLLLFFFLVAGASDVGGTADDVSPPRTSTLPPETVTSPLLVLGGRGAALTLDGRPVEPEDLPERLAGETVLYVLADENRRAGDVLARLSALGVDEMSLQLVAQDAPQGAGGGERGTAR